MARLLSYRRKDENRYSTFSNVSFGKSTDNLTIKTIPKAKMSAKISPSVHKKQCKKGSTSLPSLTNIKSRKRIREWISRCFPCHKWAKKFCCCFCFSTCCLCRRGNSEEAFNNEDDIDKAVEEYVNQQKAPINGNESQKSSLKSNQSDARVAWKWDESWKSNSDKFLEALELEGIGSDKTLQRKADKLRFKNSKVRKSAMLDNVHGGGFKSILKNVSNKNLLLIKLLMAQFLHTNTEEQANPPCSEEPVRSSPVAGSCKKIEGKRAPSTEPWPSQSDEDIDRLVAMHQNRHNSLSSLGVSATTTTTTTT